MGTQLSCKQPKRKNWIENSILCRPKNTHYKILEQ